MLSLLLLFIVPVLSERVKRQYYICECGSLTTKSSANQCTNGGQKIGVGCFYDYQCSPYSYGRTVQCLNNCCCTVPTTSYPSTVTPAVSSLAYCYNGQRTQIRCTRSTDCGTGQSCVNNLCCTTTGNEWTAACAGIAALASCVSNSTCGSFTCTASNYCCECPYGRTSGLCTNGCSTGYSCATNGYCCPTCSSGQTPYGSCYNGLCPTGYTCQSGNICC